MYRTHNCGELGIAEVDKRVTLVGWVQKIRDKGAIIWIDLRDRYGISQLLVEEKLTPEQVFQTCKTLNKEFVIQVVGTVKKRENSNLNLITGQIEIIVEELTIVNTSKQLPFIIENDTDGNEEMRMKYRYLDLRRKQLQQNIISKHLLLQQIRGFLNKHGFLEMETPILLRPTPEGAKDFLVQCGTQENLYYALPQSPQLIKQLFMISGFDRYYQIAKCFRNEELRANRQPEFSQLDCELSFVTQEDIITIFEKLTKELFLEQLNVSLPVFPRLTYREAMNKYGTDKPDLRYALEIVDISDLFVGIDLNLLPKSVAKAIRIEGLYNYSRGQIDNLKTVIKNYNSGNSNVSIKFVYIKYAPDGTVLSSVDKLASVETLLQIIHKTHSTPSDLIVIIAGEEIATLNTLGRLREYIAAELSLVANNAFEPLWVTDFPLFTRDVDRYYSTHHPFTMPKEENLYLLNAEPDKVDAQAYDLVINGVEVGGGSIRISSRKLQEQIFNILGLKMEDYTNNFGFLLEALEFGAPPHGGIAFGIDRLLSVMYKTDSIKDFIAFPKRNNGQDLMLNSPTTIL